MIDAETTATSTPEPSMDALHAMLSGKEPEPATPEQTPEPEKAPADAKSPEAEPGTAETKQEPEKAAEPEREEELPEGVKKRIAKEAEKQARIQSEIDRAVSARKAKAEELAKLQAETGSQPENKAQKSADGKPVRPNIESFDGTLAEYNAAVAKYEAEYEAWLTSETTKRVEKEFNTRMQAEEGKRAYREAVKQHAELPEATQTVIDNSDPGFQMALSSLDNWAGVTVHLGKHPEELSAIVAKFKSNPVGAIAELGKLEARLTQAPTQAKQEVKQPERMPSEPPKRVGGQASATAPRLNLEKSSDVNDATDDVLLGAIGQYLKAG